MTVVIPGTNLPAAIAAPGSFRSSNGPSFSDLLDPTASVVSPSSGADQFGAYGVFARERPLAAAVSGVDPAAIGQVVQAPGIRAQPREDEVIAADEDGGQSIRGLEARASAADSQGLEDYSRQPEAMGQKLLGISSTMSFPIFTGLEIESSNGDISPPAPRRANIASPSERSASVITKSAQDVAVAVALTSNGAHVVVRGEGTTQAVAAKIGETLSEFGIAFDELCLNGKNVAIQTTSRGRHGRNRS